MRHAEVDHQPGDVHERRDERRRRGRRDRSRAAAARTAAAIRPACPKHDADQRQADRDRDEQPVRAVDVGKNADQTVMRRKPIDAEDACPAPGPRTISRRMTRHQSRSVTSPSASARMTSVDACEPELPPLEMIERHEQREHDRLARSPSRRRPSPSPSASRRGTAPSASRRASAPCAGTRSPCRARRAPPIRRCAGFPSVAAASATSSTSSMVTMPMSMPAVSVTGSADAVVLPEHRDGRLPGRRWPSARRTAGPSGPARRWSASVSRNSRIRMSSISSPCSSTT